ncbi:MAG: Hsp33 family molecular chaperone HslO [Gallicola sp.]|nr:Hsp33 family molecular chaperone HslO [Gallicola sp.]
MKDIYVVKALDEKERYRFMLINSTELVEEMRNIHNTTTTATAALGRLTTMAAIMGTDIKNIKETLALKIKGDGPAGILIAESDSEGNIRSYMDHPEIDIPSREIDNKLDVGSFVGKNGLLSVIRDFGTGEPYIGKTAIVSGEIAEDIASYFFYSEQTPTIVSLGVLVDVDYSCKSAGGLFIQVLPGYTEADLIELEEAMKGFPSISSVFEDGYDGKDVLNKYFSSLNMKILEEKPVRYQCSCSQEKVEKAIISLGKDQIEEIAKEDQGTEVVCEFCNMKYYFTEEELRSLTSN